MAGGYLLSVLRAASRGIKVRPPKRGHARDFHSRQIEPPIGGPKRGAMSYHRVLNPGDQFEIGNHPQTHWTIDGAPRIETADGTNVLKLSMPTEAGGKVVLHRGRESREKQVEAGGAVHFIIGETLDGKACYLRIEHVQPGEA